MRVWSKFISSHRRCSVRKGVFRNFTKFTGKYLCQGLFFNEVAGVRPGTLLKKRLWHRCFPVNFVEFLRTPFFIETSGGCFYKLLIQSTFGISNKSFGPCSMKSHIISSDIELFATSNLFSVHWGFEIVDCIVKVVDCIYLFT